MRNIVFAFTVGVMSLGIGVVCAEADGSSTLSDVSYIALGRCAGLAEGAQTNASPFLQRLDVQSSGRTEDVVDRADEARTDARRAVRDSGPDGRAALAREREAACRSFEP
jgi:hypothetical protein